MPVEIDAVDDDAGAGPIEHENTVARDPVAQRPRHRARTVEQRCAGRDCAKDGSGRPAYSNQSSGWRMKKLRTTSSTSESAGSDDQSSM